MKANKDMILKALDCWVQEVREGRRSGGTVGTIVKISNTLKKITTDTGHVFWRRRDTGCWKANDTWSMRPGHFEKRNPSF